MNYYGCTFKGKHSFKDFGLIMKSDDRSVLPATKIAQVDIPFLDGKIDLQKEPIYDNRIISVTFNYSFIEAKYPRTLESIHQRKRQIANWLSGQSQLIFDDEPGKFYNAKIFNAIGFEQEIDSASFSVGFESTPFALNTPLLQTQYITIQGQRVPLDIIGNVKTAGVITLTNVGTTTITNIKIGRERGKD
jgi:predicted phage tail component-like protein